MMKKKPDPLKMPIWNQSWGIRHALLRYGEEFGVPFETVFVAGYQEYVQEEREKKFDLLFKKFGIAKNQSDSWKLLAMHLAVENYVGFKVFDPALHREVQHAGRMIVWTPFHLAMLWCEVALLRLENCANVKAALRKICKKKPWAILLGAKNLTGDALENKVRLLNKHYLAADKTELIASVKRHLIEFPDSQKPAVLASMAATFADAINGHSDPQNYGRYLERTTL